ncbi:ATP-binding protein [Niveibacterium sp.]|uniref:ATP-binding protein n=1 Tax=Niveibacterium sp. TaxID=2017444 RepID=UPI0035AD8B91
MSASLQTGVLECPQRGADLLALQNDVLEAVARGRPLHDTLDLLCRRVESLAGDVRCTVLLLDGTRLRHGAAPSVPAIYVQAIDGVEIGPAVGSCGTAAYRGEAVEVTDIANDPLWAPYKHLALPHGLKACWSTPIRARAGAVLGTFALYFGECRGAAPFHRDAVRASTHLASIAIERAAMDEAERQRIVELAESNARYEQLNRTLEQRVAERTRDLDARNIELAQAFEELQRAQHALLEARRLASLARMVAGIAHELNTPLGNARVLASTLVSRCEEFSELARGAMRRSDINHFVSDVSEAAELLEQAVASAVASVGSFKAVAVDQPASVRASFAVGDTLEYIAHLFAPALRAGHCTLQLDAPAGLMLDSYPAALQQVLSTVMDNALIHGLAGKADGHLLLAAERVADGVRIVVADNGSGIAPDVVDKVFDPFFTTRLAQGSSGLGLHVAHNLVNGVLGGEIHIDSRLGAGTTVAIQLPLSAPLRA